MSTMNDLGFHESSLIMFASNGSEAILELEGVLLAGSFVCVKVEVEKIARILSDGYEVDTVQMEAADGEILEMEVGDENLFALVEWNDFENNKSHICSYSIAAQKISVFVIDN